MVSPSTAFVWDPRGSESTRAGGAKEQDLQTLGGCEAPQKPLLSPISFHSPYIQSLMRPPYPNQGSGHSLPDEDPEAPTMMSLFLMLDEWSSALSHSALPGSPGPQSLRLPSAQRTLKE